MDLQSFSVSYDVIRRYIGDISYGAATDGHSSRKSRNDSAWSLSRQMASNTSSSDSSLMTPISFRAPSNRSAGSASNTYTMTPLLLWLEMRCNEGLQDVSLNRFYDFEVVGEYCECFYPHMSFRCYMSAGGKWRESDRMVIQSLSELLAQSQEGARDAERAGGQRGDREAEQESAARAVAAQQAAVVAAAGATRRAHPVYQAAG